MHYYEFTPNLLSMHDAGKTKLGLKYLNFSVNSFWKTVVLLENVLAPSVAVA